MEPSTRWLRYGMERVLRFLLLRDTILGVQSITRSYMVFDLDDEHPSLQLNYVEHFVNLKDFSRYPFLLPQLVSDALQNVPFCSGERGLQWHSLLADATPSPRQLCLASSHPLPSLLLIQKVRFVGKNCCIFLVPGPTSTRYTETAPFGLSRFQPSVLHEAGKKYFCTWY